MHSASEQVRKKYGVVSPPSDFHYNVETGTSSISFPLSKGNDSRKVRTFLQTYSKKGGRKGLLRNYHIDIPESAKGIEYQEDFLKRVKKNLPLNALSLSGIDENFIISKHKRISLTGLFHSMHRTKIKLNSIEINFYYLKKNETKALLKLAKGSPLKNLSLSSFLPNYSESNHRDTFNTAMQLSYGLQKLKDLKKFSLGNTELSRGEFVMLMNSLSKLKTLNVFELYDSQNYIKDRTRGAVSNCLTSNMITKLILVNEALYDIEPLSQPLWPSLSQKLETLVLVNWPLTEKDILLLKERQLPLTTLHLQTNSLCNIQTELLAQFLDSLPTLQNLSLLNNQLNERAIKILAPYFQNLQELNLSFNRSLKNEGIEAVMAAISQNNQLKKLVLNDVGITTLDSFLKHLQSPNFPHLQKLMLQGMIFKDTEITALFERLLTMKITHIALEWYKQAIKEMPQEKEILKTVKYMMENKYLQNVGEDFLKTISSPAWKNRAQLPSQVTKRLDHKLHSSFFPFYRPLQQLNAPQEAPMEMGNHLQDFAADALKHNKM